MAHDTLDSLWNWGAPHLSEERFRARLDEEELRGASTEDILLVKTQIARSLGLQRKFEEAHTLLDEVESHLDGQPTLVTIRYHLERGRVYNSSAKKENAIPHFTQAYELAMETKFEYYAIDAAHMLGIACQSAEALSWNELAIAMTETATDERAKGWLGPLYNNTGWTYYDMGEYKRALALFESDVKYRTERGRDAEARIARYSVGKTLRALKRIDEALDIQRKIEKDIRENTLDPDGYVYEEIAECLLAQADAGAAKSYFKQAYDILGKDIWLRSNEKERLERLEKLSQ